MSALSILLIAISLSLDSFAVSVTAGASHKKALLSAALKVALIFSLFQMAMPVAGWLIGQSLKGILHHTDHWIAFGLLLIIGIKMIYEATKPERDETPRTNVLRPHVLLALGFATSIDALAMGVSFALLKAPLLALACIIGITTFVMCFMAFNIGKKCGHVLENKFEIIGGFILIALGIKILIGHLYF